MPFSRSLKFACMDEFRHADLMEISREQSTLIAEWSAQFILTTFSFGMSKVLEESINYLEQDDSGPRPYSDYYARAYAGWSMISTELRSIAARSRILDIDGTHGLIASMLHLWALNTSAHCFELCFAPMCATIDPQYAEDLLDVSSDIAEFTEDAAGEVEQAGNPFMLIEQCRS